MFSPQTCGYRSLSLLDVIEGDEYEADQSLNASPRSAGSSQAIQADSEQEHIILRHMIRLRKGAVTKGGIRPPQ
jgi:hypothetical protein